MPFCRECGKEVQNDWKTCPHCSSSLTESSQGISVQDSAISGDVIGVVNDPKAISEGYKQALKEIEEEKQKEIDEEEERKRIAEEEERKRIALEKEIERKEKEERKRKRTEEWKKNEKKNEEIRKKKNEERIANLSMRKELVESDMIKVGRKSVIWLIFGICAFLAIMMLYDFMVTTIDESMSKLAFYGCWVNLLFIIIASVAWKGTADKWEILDNERKELENKLKK